MKVWRQVLGLFAALLLFAAHPALAVDKAAVERQFQTWLKQDIWPLAKAAGISKATFDATAGAAGLDWKLPGLVPPGEQLPKEQHQAEFRSPAGYFSEKVLGAVIAGGETRYPRYRALLGDLETKTGVPGRIVLAVWGRESGFGRAAVPYNAFDVLATRAFMSTRPELFRGELVAAMAMVETGHVPPERMKSSWAGALGQPQFMPSSWLAHAADGDGDGFADIWKSDADALASIANFLRHKGWVAGRDWGFEVTVPDGISCALEGPDRGKPIAQWARLGIERVSGRPFPAHEMNAEGYLLMPAGRFGPAFIVTPNFYVLKEYNTSDLYALFVGHAADRIEYGGSPFAGAWGKVDTLYRSDIAAMQRRLEVMGYDVGGADGLPGYKTRRSIGEWQASTGAKPACLPTAEILRTLK